MKRFSMFSAALVFAAMVTGSAFGANPLPFPANQVKEVFIAA